MPLHGHNFELNGRENLRKDALQPQDSCATLESHNIKSGHMVNKLSTSFYHVDHDPMIKRVCVTI